MLSAAILIATISCTAPRMTFREFFSATHAYQFGKPPRGFPADLAMRDAINSLAEFSDYFAAYNEKCRS